MDLKEYFNEHRNDYYANHFNFSEDLSYVDEYQVYDVEEAIKFFKELIQPYSPAPNDYDDKKKNEEFIYLCNYLNENNYIIKQFPSYLKRPDSRDDFTNKLLKEETRKFYGIEGNVKWPKRREYIGQLEIIPNYESGASEDLKAIIDDISTSKKDFEKMTLDEKICNLNNIIEHILKKDGKFIIADYSKSNGILTDQVVKDYRKKTHCFRHATEEALKDRTLLDDVQKQVYVNFGILIIEYLIAMGYYKS